MIREKILILARAIPERSKKHGDTICVAGLNTNLEWRRLYPFKFYKALSFPKRSVIWVELELPDSKKDKRWESRKVLKHWLAQEERVADKKVKDILQKIKNHSIVELQNKEASLGVITPRVHDIKIKINSTNIINPQLKILWADSKIKVGQEEFKKLPIEASYIFTCEQPSQCSCIKKPHELRIVDWEINELFRNLVKQHGDNTKLIEEKIKERFFNWMLTKRDLYLILGTHYRFSTWMIVGIFYPKKIF